MIWHKNVLLSSYATGSVGLPACSNDDKLQFISVFKKCNLEWPMDKCQGMLRNAKTTTAAKMATSYLVTLWLGRLAQSVLLGIHILYQLNQFDKKSQRSQQKNHQNFQKIVQKRQIFLQIAIYSNLINHKFMSLVTLGDKLLQYTGVASRNFSNTNTY